MSAKTKIVVLHMKKLIIAGTAAGLGVLIVLLLFLLSGSKGQDTDSEAVDTMYIPGVYTSSVTIDGNSFDVQVSVDEDHISDVSLVSLDESVETMYPLIRPTLDELAEQIVENQSLDGVTSPENSPYTSQLLLDAVSRALEKASPAQ